MRYFIAVLTLLVFPFSAQAAFLSISDRAEQVEKQTKGNNSYQAYLARKFADYATEEVAQHDLRTGRAFIQMAEEAAKKAGGSK